MPDSLLFGGVEDCIRFSAGTAVQPARRRRCHCQEDDRRLGLQELSGRQQHRLLTGAVRRRYAGDDYLGLNGGPLTRLFTIPLSKGGASTASQRPEERSSDASQVRLRNRYLDAEQQQLRSRRAGVGYPLRHRFSQRRGGIGSQRWSGGMRVNEPIRFTARSPAEGEGFEPSRGLHP
jgi:hypothetical protein